MAIPKGNTLIYPIWLLPNEIKSTNACYSEQHIFHFMTLLTINCRRPISQKKSRTLEINFLSTSQECQGTYGKSAKEKIKGMLISYIVYTAWPKRKMNKLWNPVSSSCFIFSMFSSSRPIIFVIPLVTTEKTFFRTCNQIFMTFFSVNRDVPSESMTVILWPDSKPRRY